MSSYIDIKYLNIISPQLQKFKKKGNNLWNFRCPYCGDSQKNKTKARGFVYQKKNDFLSDIDLCVNSFLPTRDKIRKEYLWKNLLNDLTDGKIF